MLAITATVALLAAGGVAAVVAAQSEPAGEAAPVPTLEPRPGGPPLALELGFRTDAEAVALRRGETLVNDDRRAAALAVFRRFDSLEAKVGAAIASWPNTTTARLAQLAALYPRSALVQLHLGLARFWEGGPGAEEAWREAAGAEPDTPYAVIADGLLHPDVARGLPQFVPSFGAPAAVRALPPGEQLGALERAARDGTTRDRLLYGVGLQRAGRPVSARRVFDEAARRAPDDVEALTAAAVGRYEKERPAAAFSRLGPLSRRFPQAATVRFHLGLLLLWSGDAKEARRQLRLAVAAEPGSPLARQARRTLDRLPPP